MEEFLVIKLTSFSEGAEVSRIIGEDIESVHEQEDDPHKRVLVLNMLNAIEVRDALNELVRERLCGYCKAISQGAGLLHQEMCKAPKGNTQ